MIKSSGPRILPCGTPYLSFSLLESVLLTCVYCSRSDKIRGRVQAEGDKLKTPKFGKLFELLLIFEIVSQSQKSLVHSWVIVVRTGCHSQILLIIPNLRLTAVFVTFREGSFPIITFDLEPYFFNSHAEKAFAYP